MTDKRLCNEHSGVEARTCSLEKAVAEVKADIKAMSARLNRWGGVISGLVAIPLILKIIEILTPVARAENSSMPINPSIIDRIVESAHDGEWTLFVGAVLLLLVITVRRITRGRLSDNTTAWISAVSALVAGISTAMIAGASWYYALLIGLFASGASDGFWTQINRLLPKKSSPRVPPLSVLLLLSVVALTSCGQPWQIARGTIHGTRSAMTELEPIIMDEEGGEEAIDAIGAALELGEQAVNIWEREGSPNPPTGWNVWVADALEAVNTAMNLARDLGAPIPRLAFIAVETLMALLSMNSSNNSNSSGTVQ